MIISRTPFRISFLGGGTDYPEYFNEHGGAILGTSITRYCYVGIRDGKIWSSFDVPSRSGLGTSSAYTVGLLKAFSKQDNISIARLATIIERDKLDNKVGYQDQYLCAVGGLHLLRFYASGIVDKPLKCDWLKNYLLLFDTGQYRSAGKVVASQLERVEDNQSALNQLKQLALDGEKIIENKDYLGFGKSLAEGWELKKSLSPSVTTPFTDDIYDKAIRAGAIGGKLLGAGGGGFILFFAEPERHEGIKQALELINVPFKFDAYGSKIIYDNVDKP